MPRRSSAEPKSCTADSCTWGPGSNALDPNTYQLTVTPDGRCLLIGHRDGQVTLWDLEKCRQVISLKGHKGEVRAVDITPDGRFALSVGLDRTLRYWHLPAIGGGK